MRKQILFFPAIILVGISANAQLYGVDISHYNNEYGAISWSTIYAAGKSFAYVKATEGVNTNDAYFSTNMTSSNPNGVVRGAYHLARPEFSSNNTPTNEANHFLGIASSYIGNGFLPAALDMEQTFVNTYISQGNSYNQLAQWINTWCTLVHTSSGKWPVLYTSKCAAASLYLYFQNGTINANIKLWIATNNISTDPAGSPGTNACSASWSGWPWVFHQYFAPGAAGNNPTTYANPGMDQDIFNGSQTAFDNLVNSSSATATITSFSISPTVVSPCNNCFTITYNINASSAMTVILGGSIRVNGGSTFISDPAHDVAVNLPAGTSTQTRTFCVTAGTSLGLYDVITALWKDNNSNNQIDAGDTQLSTAANNGILTINSGTLSAPTATAASNVSTSGFTANWNSASGATSYFLDVSTNSSFSTLLNGYSDQPVNNVTSYNVTGLSCNTTYYYRVRANNSCGTTTNSNTITSTTSGVPTQPSAITGNQTVCQGSTQPYLVTSVPSVTYTWTLPAGWSGSSSSNSISLTVGSSGGTVGVVANNGCGTSTASTLPVSVNTSVTPNISIMQSSCNGGTTVSFSSTVTNQGNNPSYFWSITGPGSSSNNTSSGFTVTNASNSTQVKCILTSNAICATATQVSSNIVTVSTCTAIPTIDGMQFFVIAPNPTSGVFTVTIKLSIQKSVRFRLYNILGQTVYTSPTYMASGAFTKQIVGSELPNGVYELETEIGGRRFVQRIMIQRR